MPPAATAPSAKDRRRAWLAIAYFLGEGQRPPRRVQAHLVGELARAHRLDAALAEPRLTAVSPAEHLPASVWNAFQRAHSAALVHAVRRETPLREALAALAPKPVIVFKGAALGELLYPTPAARGMADVDILVHPDSLEESLHRLAPLGYQRCYEGHPVFDAPAFHERQLQGPLDLDLHQAFLQTAWFPVDYRAVFARAIPWHALAPNAFVLAPADAVVHACVEVVKDVGAAIGLLDLRLMLSRRGPFWGTFGPALDRGSVAITARAWGAERMVHAALRLLQRHFPSLAPEVARVRPAISLLVAAAIERVVVARCFPPRVELPGQRELWGRRFTLLRPTAQLRYVTSNWPRLVASARLPRLP